MCEYIKLAKGIYRVKGSNNPFHKYMIEKKYGNETKRKYFETLEDCKDQIDEWDEMFFKSNKGGTICSGLAGLNHLVNEEVGFEKYSEKEAKTVYVYNAITNELVDADICPNIAIKFNTTPHNIYNVVRENRLFKNLYNITYYPRAMASV